MGSLIQAARDFLIVDGVSISPVMRTVIYGALFVYAVIAPYGGVTTGGPIGDSPLQADVIMEQCDRRLWIIRCPWNRLFLLFHHPRLLRVMTRLAAFFWTWCIVGFGGIYSRLLLAASIFILAGCNYGVLKVGVSHNWYVPTWTIVALVFTTFRQGSVDAWLFPHSNCPWESHSVLMDSALSSKFIQCIAYYTLFAAGFNKVRFGNFKWLHPATLTFYASDPSIIDILHCSKPRKVLRGAFVHFPLVVSLAATLAITWELVAGATLLLTDFYFRAVAVFLSWLFHLGIFAIMGPNYLPQCICYLAAIGDAFQSQLVCPTNDWGLRTIVTTNFIIDRTGDFVGRCFNCLACHADSVQTLDSYEAAIVVAIYVVLCGYAISLVLTLEAFPFTPVPMFCMPRVGFRHDYISNEAQLHAIAHEFPIQGGATVGGEDQILEGDTWIKLTLNNTPEPVTDTIGSHIATTPHFRLCLTSALIQTVRQDSGKPLHDFLRKVKEIAIERQLLTQDDHLSCYVHFQSGWKPYVRTND